MQHAAILSSAASLAPPNFSTLSHKRHDFRGKKKLLKIKCVFRFSLQLLFEMFLILRRIKQDIFINVKKYLYVKYPLLFSEYKNFIFSTYFRKMLKCQVSSKFVYWEPSCFIRTDGWTDKHT
jgi:hypothetical protein